MVDYAANYKFPPALDSFIAQVATEAARAGGPVSNAGKAQIIDKAKALLGHDVAAHVLHHACRLAEEHAKKLISTGGPTGGVAGDLQRGMQPPDYRSR